MKNLYLFLLLIFLVSFSYAQDQDLPKVIEIPESYADRQGPPFKVKEDSLYVFRTPHVYLINEKAFTAFKNIYEATRNQDEMTNSLIEKYTQTLSRNIDLERKLKINFKETDSLDLQVYQRTQATLSNTQRALDYTINSLDKATTSLELVEKSTKRERRKSAFEKILFAIGGVGIGVLVGVSL